LSVVIPLCNEAGGINKFHEDLSDALSGLDYDCSIWYIDDGSTDSTLDRLKAIAGNDQRVRIVEFSRNFGQPAAIAAGMERAAPGIVIVMDGDGQHPPSLIPELVRLHEQGADLVQAQRIENPGAGLWKHFTSSAFNWVINRLTDLHLIPGSADYRLMSRPVVEALRSMGEYHRFPRGMVSWTGFRPATAPYAAPERLTGESKYSVVKLIHLASHAIFYHSRSPLRLCYALGAVLMLLSLVQAIYTLVIYFSPQRSTLPPGWPTLMFFVLLNGGLQLFMLGIVAHYIGFIFDEVKRRPLYVVRRVHGRIP